jgi:hypothetical protein
MTDIEYAVFNDRNTPYWKHNTTSGKWLFDEPIAKGFRNARSAEDRMRTLAVYRTPVNGSTGLCIKVREINRSTWR